MAITDHGRCLGSIGLYKKLKEAGIKYIHGCEVYICQDTSIKDKDNKYNHLLILCKDETGRQNLNKLLSLSEHPTRFYSKPRIDFNLLSEYKDGLVVSSACLAGEIPAAIMRGDLTLAEETAYKYKELLGDDFYLEIQSRLSEDQITVNKQVVEIARKLDIGLVATSDAHYVWEKDKKYQAKYAFNGAYKEDGENYQDCYIQSEAEVREKLYYLPEDIINEAIENTHKISEKCNLEMPLSPPIMPHIDTPSEFVSNREWLENICIDGFRGKLNIDYYNHRLCDPNKFQRRFFYNEDGEVVGFEDYQLTQDEINGYISRYEYELNSLARMEFIDYILLVYSYANKGSRRGIARGSGGGSLICYLTHITDIDPIEHGLYFERFIDVGALDLLESGQITTKELKIPDIDLDFSNTSRDEILRFLYKQYGEENVASIGRFGTSLTKGIIRDMCKAFDFPLELEDKIAKSFEMYEINDIDMMLSGEIPTTASAADAIMWIHKYPELFEYVRKLVGLPKSFGLHPCFVEDSLVLAADGYKEIQNIAVGDMVLTHNNRYCKVRDTFINHAKEIIEIQSVGTIPINCTPNHPFYVKKRIKNTRNRKFSEPEWVEAGEIQKGDLLGMAVNQNAIIPEYYDLPTDNEDFWWVIGRYIGDGWTECPKGRNEKRVKICCSKKGIRYLNDILVKCNMIFKFRIEEHRTAYKIHLLDKTLYDFLQQFGKYAHGKILTGTILNLPIHLLRSFLDGYFSADGYVAKDGSISFKTTSLKLATGLIHCIAKAYGRHCGIHKICAKTEVIEDRVVQSKEKYAVLFTKEMREKEHNFYDGNYIWLYVKSIVNKQEPTTVYNFSVEEDESYTVSNIIVHNCGKVISTKELDYFLPSCYDADGIRYLQGDMYDVEDVGLVKVDVLGLRTIDQEYNTLELSGEDMGFIDSKQDFSDPKVLRVFNKGDTEGVFQMSSWGMKKTIKQMNVQSLNELAVAIALYRPGPMLHIDSFCERRKGKEAFKYLHPDLEPILKNTYGIIVFQEQLIEIGRMAGLRNPDLIRQATAKKKPELLVKVKPELEEKFKSKGWTQEQFDQLWSDILEFAKYSFGKAHASGYAIIAYMTAKQKVYYPNEFYAGLMNSYIGKSDYVKEKAAIIFSDMSSHGVNLAPLNFRQDHRRCWVNNGRIIYAIPLIRDLSVSTAEALFHIKDKQFEYFWECLYELIHSYGVPKNQISRLVKLGFFHEFGHVKHLLSIIDIFTYFKDGTALRITKARFPYEGTPLEEILKTCSQDKNKDGSVSASYRITDMPSLLNRCELYIKEQPVTDFDLKFQIGVQQDSLGFAPIPTGIEGDRPKLYIREIFPVKRKKDGVRFGYNIVARSLGSGIENRYTVYNTRYNATPIDKGDIVLCRRWYRENGFLTLDSYDKLA